jgi:hypothetical protein
MFSISIMEIRGGEGKRVVGEEGEGRVGERGRREGRSYLTH